MVIKRGDIFYADLRPVVGSEQGGVRPVLIIQNDVGNRHSPTVICAAITSKMNKAKLPTHIEIDASSYGIEKDSVILLEQLRTIDKKRLKDKVCHLDQTMLDRVNHALEISLELTFYAVILDEQNLKCYILSVIMLICGFIFSVNNRLRKEQIQNGRWQSIAPYGAGEGNRLDQ